MTGNMVTIFLNTELTQLQHSLNPAVVEILKVLVVSFLWIGGLGWFMWKKDKNKQKANA
jgi:hypothetical protein